MSRSFTRYELSVRMIVRGAGGVREVSRSKWLECRNQAMDRKRPRGQTASTMS